jgi:hypothetical protein
MGSELELMREPDWEWFKQVDGLYGVWAGGSLDGWVGKEGPLVQEILGESRVAVLDNVPHAFCLCE